MRAANLTIADDARAALTALLGGDRLASRNELRKLALYAQGKERVELADIRAVVSDASEQELDGVLDAAFAGDTRDVETEFGKARAGGSAPSTIVSAAIRQVANLHRMKLAIEAGDSIDFAMKRGAPPVHFSREKIVGEALRAWTPAETAAHHGAACRSLARGAPPAGARRNDRPAHAAVDCGECASARSVILGIAKKWGRHHPRKRVIQ